MRRSRLRARVPALLTVAVVVVSTGVLFLPGPAAASSDAGAVISNGTVQLGVNALGDLNYTCSSHERSGCPGPSAGGGGSATETVGIRYQPLNLEGAADGSPAEGWGVADAGSGLTGSVNENVDGNGGTVHVSGDSFTTTADTATSVVTVADPELEGHRLRVRQSYAPSPASPNVYANTVTITNTGDEAVGDLRYRRNVDWDVEPTAFNEWVTAGGSTDPPLLFNSDDGFASSDPLAGPSYDQSSNVCDTTTPGPCNYTDLGAGGTYADGVRQAADHGALYDFGFGALDVGASRTFTVFYGAAPDEATATAALAAAGAQTFSLAESACTGGTVDDCQPTPSGGGDGGGGDGCTECARGRATPAAEAPPGEPAGVTLGEPVTFMLGFATSTADVSVQVGDDPDPVVVGSQLTYDLAVTNNGPQQATGVSVQDTLPTGVTLSSITPEQGTCTGTAAITCVLGTLEADATTHVRIAVTPTVATTISDTATVSSGSYDPNPDNNSDTERTTVAPVPPPVANADTYGATEDTPLVVSAVNGVLANDTNPSGVGTLTVAPGTTGPTNGTVTLDDDGSFTYQPGANFHGTDSFVYRVTNGDDTSGPATATITVASANDPPVAAGDAYTVDEDTTLTVAAPGVLGNDTDVDNDALTAALVTGPAHGQLTLGADGTVTYTPAHNYNGTDTFTYRASDGPAQSAPATVSLTVSPVADPVGAVDDSYTTARDTPLSVAAPGVLGNDTNAGVDGPTTVTQVAPTTHGTLTLNPDGSFGYVPDAGFVGDDSFRYTVGGESVATVTITVTRGANRAPVANDDSYQPTEDTPFTEATPATGVLGNDTDPDGDTFSIVQHTNPEHGSLVLQNDGTFTYTPDPNFHGQDSFTYRISDGSLTSGAATVSIDVGSVDDPPTGKPDEYTTPTDTTLTVAAPGVLANDSDVDGDSLYVTDVGAPAHGTVDFTGGDDAQGGFTYTPAPGFIGTDSFTYRVGAGEASSAPVTVTIHVTPVNHAPIAVPDAYSTSRNTTLIVALPGVLANDSDPDGNAISAARTSGPAHGALTLNANGRVHYVPDAGFTGTDSFRYRAGDGLLSSPSVRVTITVTAPATPPVTTPPTSDVPVPPTTPPGTPTPPTDGPSTNPPVDQPTDTPTTPDTTPPPSTPPTSTPPTTTPPTTTPPSGTPQRTLRLTAPSVIPGGALRAAGSGCAGSSAVQLTIAGRPAGSGTADAGGRFDVPVTTTGLGVGTYSVTATCGDRQQVADVALVYVTANSNAPTAQALVVAAALAFFLLLLGLVARRPTS